MRILIADHHALFRDGLRGLLERRDHQVVGEASNGREAVELACRLRTDLVLLDLEMPVMDGLEAIPILSAKLPEVRVGVLTVSRPVRRHQGRTAAAPSGYATGGLTYTRLTPRCADQRSC